MSKIYVSYNSHCIKSERSDEAYGDWYELNTFRVEKVSLTEPKDRYFGSCDTIDLGYDVEPGIPIYVLVLIYSHGDSFGHSEGNGEIVWAFTDADVANNVRNHVEENIGKYSILYRNEKDVEITFSNPASGYFEHMESLDVDTFLLNP